MEDNFFQIVGLYIVAMVFGGYVGIMFGAFIGQTSGSGDPPVGSSFLGGAIGSLILTALIHRLIIEHNKAKKPAKDKAYQEARIRQDREYAERRAREEAQRQAKAWRELRDFFPVNARQAVETFQRLPKIIASVRFHRNESVKHFKAGAFSPFWSEIERAFSDLGTYRETVILIETMACKHTDALREYSNKHRKDPSPAPFPIDLSAAAATSIGQQATADLQKIVYRAQQEPVFAQIWEQRRTTKVLINGFANLENAVDGLRYGLEDCTSRLQAAIETNAGQISRSLSSSTNRVNSTLNELSDSNSQAIGSLEREMTASTWYLKQAWKQELLS